jgi:double-stranded uracil-DNA glycosylase
MTTTIIDDVLQPNLRVVFCGTALGNASAMAKAYYAHPRSLFWDTLHEIGLTWADAPLLPHEYRRALDFGIGLTDLCKSASGNDADLPPGAFDVHALREKIDQCRPLFLAFTSKRAGRAFCGSKVELGWQQRLRQEPNSTSCLRPRPTRAGSGKSTSTIGRCWRTRCALPAGRADNIVSRL